MTREEALKILKDCRRRGFERNTYTVEEYHTAMDIAIEALAQESKTGHWISHYDEDAKEGWYECDRCHTERAFNTDYCPDCGCRMIEPQESEDKEWNKTECITR